ncbi:MAG: hypothetical protein R3236_06465 [Phycisphaeraceae bacterium]|nr:hypothetical protein [Phycisphaeraceae bacterium]
MNRSNDPTPQTFTREWLIALAVLWIVSAGCALLMAYFVSTESRYLQDAALEGAVGLMLAQHVMTLAVGAITARINRASGTILSVACLLITLTLGQGGFLIWLLLR